MTTLAWLAVAAAAGAVVLAWPVRPRLETVGVASPSERSSDWMVQRRPVWAALSGLAPPMFVDGPVSWAAGISAAFVVWLLIARAEPAEVRRARESLKAELPHVVGLLGDALRAGQAPAAAIALVAEALPGVASARLADVSVRLRLGADPIDVWRRLEDDPELAPLGRALARAQQTGVPVVATVERLATELSRDARAAVEDRARAIGVKAALPLGVCLLPAFLLVGIVPLVAGLLSTISLG